VMGVHYVACGLMAYDGFGVIWRGDMPSERAPFSRERLQQPAFVCLVDYGRCGRYTVSLIIW
jgi:hypothetical protein